jgi:hypothetical protein
MIRNFKQPDTSEYRLDPVIGQEQNCCRDQRGGRRNGEPALELGVV